MANSNATQTGLRTAEGLVVYDLAPQAAELWAVAGQSGVDPSAIDPDNLLEGFRWVDESEWETLQLALIREVAEAVDAAGVFCPEAVADACIRIALTGGDWRGELRAAITNDAREAIRLAC